MKPASNSSIGPGAELGEISVEALAKELLGDATTYSIYLCNSALRYIILDDVRGACLELDTNNLTSYGYETYAAMKLINPNFAAKVLARAQEVPFHNLYIMEKILGADAPARDEGLAQMAMRISECQIGLLSFLFHTKPELANAMVEALAARKVSNPEEISNRDNDLQEVRTYLKVLSAFDADGQLIGEIPTTADGAPAFDARGIITHLPPRAAFTLYKRYPKHVSSGMWDTSCFIGKHILLGMDPEEIAEHLPLLMHGLRSDHVFLPGIRETLVKIASRVPQDVLEGFLKSVDPWNVFAYDAVAAMLPPEVRAKYVPGTAAEAAPLAEKNEDSRETPQGLRIWLANASLEEIESLRAQSSPKALWRIVHDMLLWPGDAPPNFALKAADVVRHYARKGIFTIEEVQELAKERKSRFDYRYPPAIIKRLPKVMTAILTD
jgi:hypothetical protein